MKSRKVYPGGSAPAHALEVALGALAQAGLTREKLWLGGGATLAARWEHREDPSVSVFCLREDFEATLGSNGPRGLSKKLHTRTGEDTEGAMGWVRWQTGAGKVGLFSSDPIGGPGLSDETEEATGLRIEAPQGVLHKKLAGRARMQGEVLDRDLMDLVACSRRAPDVLRKTLRRSAMDGHRSYADEIRFQRAILPKRDDKQGRALEALSEEAAHLFEHAPRTTRPCALPPWMHDVPHAERAYPPPDHMGFHDREACVPAERYKDFTEETPFIPEPNADYGAEPYMAMWKNTAGHGMHADAHDIHRWLHEDDPDRLPDGALSWLNDALIQMTGEEAIAWRQTCGASLFQIARLAEAARPHGLTFPPWLNRYAYRRAGDLREEVEGYRWLGSSRYGA